jgi:hypothetical protein
MSPSQPIELHVAQSGDPFLVHPDGWVRIVQDNSGFITITFMDGGSTRVVEDYLTVKRLLIGGSVE